MGFVEAIGAVFGSYATFRGRASRPEFWWWMLFTLLVDIAGSIVDGVTRSTLGFSFVGVALSLALVVPTLAVSVRRLHDSDLSGWWVLLPFGAGTLGSVLVIAGFVALLADGLSGSGSTTGGIGLGLVVMLAGVVLALAGLAAQLVLMLRRSTPGPNRFGPGSGPASYPPYPSYPGYPGYPGYPPYPPGDVPGAGPGYPPTW